MPSQACAGERNSAKKELAPASLQDLAKDGVTEGFRIRSFVPTRGLCPARFCARGACTHGVHAPDSPAAGLLVQLWLPWRCRRHGSLQRPLRKTAAINPYRPRTTPYPLRRRVPAHVAPLVACHGRGGRFSASGGLASYRSVREGSCKSRAFPLQPLFRKLAGNARTPPRMFARLQKRLARCKLCGCFLSF